MHDTLAYFAQGNILAEPPYIFKSDCGAAVQNLKFALTEAESTICVLPKVPKNRLYTWEEWHNLLTKAGFGAELNLGVEFLYNDTPFNTELQKTKEVVIWWERELKARCSDWPKMDVVKITPNQHTNHQKGLLSIWTAYRYLYSNHYTGIPLIVKNLVESGYFTELDALMFSHSILSKVEPGFALRSGGVAVSPITPKELNLWLWGYKIEWSKGQYRRFTNNTDPNSSCGSSPMSLHQFFGKPLYIFKGNMYNSDALLQANTALTDLRAQIQELYGKKEYKSLADLHDNLYDVYVSKLPKNIIKELKPAPVSEKLEAIQ